jgi:hypothetical protein
VLYIHLAKFKDQVFMDITQYLKVPTGPPYYGNAEPEGQVVIVGGQEVVTSGWAEYEINRRSVSRVRGGSKEDHQNYPGRYVINSQDVIESIFETSTPNKPEFPLVVAGKELIVALNTLKEKQYRATGGAIDFLERSNDAVIYIPAIDVNDVRKYMRETDFIELRHLDNALTEITGKSSDKKHPPVMPRRKVAVSDPTAVSGLEKDTVNAVNAIENYQAEIAEKASSAALIIMSPLNT